MNYVIERLDVDLAAEQPTEPTLRRRSVSNDLDRDSATSMRVLLVGESSHSHGPFLRRIAARLAGDAETDLHLIELPRGIEARLVDNVPGLGGLDFQPLRWRLRESWRARRIIAAAKAPDVAFINTQTCALLAGAQMKKIPAVVSVDATGRQFAALEYWHPQTRATGVSDAPLEQLERRALQRATTVLAWSEWTARSLRDDYGVPDSRISVVHPGVDDHWLDLERGVRNNEAMKILFVGNFATRKGLPTLLEAIARIERPVELHVVSSDADLVVPAANVFVHRGLESGGEELRRRFADADVFALPTQADAVPWAVAEAMAAGLPIVATEVGAIPEMVADCGEIIPRDDVPALTAALSTLADDPVRRTEMGARARARAREHYAGRQIARILAVLGEARDRHAKEVR